MKLIHRLTAFIYKSSHRNQDNCKDFGKINTYNSIFFTIAHEITIRFARFLEKVILCQQDEIWQ